jgi:hypothetical protein
MLGTDAGGCGEGVPGGEVRLLGDGLPVGCMSLVACEGLSLSLSLSLSPSLSVCVCVYLCEL